jgi:hypothetical protein
MAAVVAQRRRSVGCLLAKTHFVLKIMTTNKIKTNKKMSETTKQVK